MIKMPVSEQDLFHFYLLFFDKIQNHFGLKGWIHDHGLRRFFIQEDGNVIAHHPRGHHPNFNRHAWCTFRFFIKVKIITFKIKTETNIIIET